MQACHIEEGPPRSKTGRFLHPMIVFCMVRVFSVPTTTKVYILYKCCGRFPQMTSHSFKEEFFYTAREIAYTALLKKCTDLRVRGRQFAMLTNPKTSESYNRSDKT